MNLLEHDAKTDVLGPAGIKVPAGVWCEDPAAARRAAETVGRCVVKAQVPSGHRGKTGGVRMADTPEEAERAARDVFALTFGGHLPVAVLVEPRVAIAREFYAAALNDPRERAPLVMFSTSGGMEIEEIAASKPKSIARRVIRPLDAFDAATAETMIDDTVEGAPRAALADVLLRLYRRYRETDAELIEINPLAALESGALIALDCKCIVDDAARFRQPALAAKAVPEALSERESQARSQGLRYIALGGSVGVLANGAGLTMTTMDVVSHFGGAPANFLEIGGDAYVKAEAALALVLGNPDVRSLVVNFCGAFARTDVMARGVVEAWRRLKPSVPVFFSVHGTGEAEARALIRKEFSEPFDLMEDAVRAAVRAAG